MARASRPWASGFRLRTRPGTLLPAVAAAVVFVAGASGCGLFGHSEPVRAEARYVADGTAHAAVNGSAPGSPVMQRVARGAAATSGYLGAPDQALPFDPEVPAPPQTVEAVERGATARAWWEVAWGALSVLERLLLGGAGAGLLGGLVALLRRQGLLGKALTTVVRGVQGLKDASPGVYEQVKAVVTAQSKLADFHDPLRRLVQRIKGELPPGLLARAWAAVRRYFARKHQS